MFGRLFEPAGSVTWPLNPSAGVFCPSLASDGPEPCPPRRLSRRAPSRTPSQSPRPRAPRAPHRGALSDDTETHAAARAEATRRCSRQCAGGTTISRAQENRCPAARFVRAKEARVQIGPFRHAGHTDSPVSSVGRAQDS